MTAKETNKQPTAPTNYAESFSRLLPANDLYRHASYALEAWPQSFLFAYGDTIQSQPFEDAHGQGRTITGLPFIKTVTLRRDESGIVIQCSNISEQFSWVLQTLAPGLDVQAGASVTAHVAADYQTSVITDTNTKPQQDAAKIASFLLFATACFNPTEPATSHLQARHQHLWTYITNMQALPVYEKDEVVIQTTRKGKTLAVPAPGSRAHKKDEQQIIASLKERLITAHIKDILDLLPQINDTLATALIQEGKYVHNPRYTEAEQRIVLGRFGGDMPRPVTIPNSAKATGIITIEEVAEDIYRQHWKQADLVQNGTSLEYQFKAHWTYDGLEFEAELQPKTPENWNSFIHPRLVNPGAHIEVRVAMTVGGNVEAALCGYIPGVGGMMKNFVVEFAEKRFTASEFFASRTSPLELMRDFILEERHNLNSIVQHGYNRQERTIKNTQVDTISYEKLMGTLLEHSTFRDWPQSKQILLYAHLWMRPWNLWTYWKVNSLFPADKVGRYLKYYNWRRDFPFRNGDRKRETVLRVLIGQELGPFLYHHFGIHIANLETPEIPGQKKKQKQLSAGAPALLDENTDQ